MFITPKFIYKKQIMFITSKDINTNLTANQYLNDQLKYYILKI
jgi:hypothetical protein